MADRRDRVVVEAHGLRKATALAALLHGSRHGPRDLKRPYAALVVGVLLGVVLLVALWAAHRVTGLLHQQKAGRASVVSTTDPAGVGALSR
ncbi:hypothetical protein ACNTMW_20175 [Planosporangium sp. 12N6]|uniref:hypothetical protein n=1 Tax=Planosporangium spinosum TaxID=3402278 RepID=UPI003CF1D34F